MSLSISRHCRPSAIRLLGWTTVGDHQYYVRQFRDMKGAISVDGIDAATLADYAGVCAAAARQGTRENQRCVNDRGLRREGDKLDVALARFARAYADQTERDYEALLRAVRHGRLPAERDT